MKNMKSEKGAITIIVLVSILFMVGFLISSYIIIANKVKAQKDVTEEIQRIYGSDRSMEEIYDSYFEGNDVIPIYTVEQLLEIGTGNSININGTIYIFSNDKIYVLMNDLEFSVVEEGLDNWINFEDRIDFEGTFDYGNKTITVTNLDESISIYP